VAQMKILRRTKQKTPLSAFQKCLGLLLAFFALGCLLGYLARSCLSATGFSELAAYLNDYVSVFKDSQAAPVGLISVIWIYFRYPFLFFILGLLPQGKRLIPLLCMMEGFFLSFSVFCFAAALGHNGVLLALAAFGTRCLFVLPCSFLLAAQGCVNKNTGGKRTLPGEKGASHTAEKLWRFVICTVVLAVGCFLELSLVPKILALAFTKI
jgi:hypothetical protein